MKKYAVVILAMFIGLFTGSIALASAIKTWSTGETLTAADLNATFLHLHNTMVGGHGARLVNGDVSASAAIGHAKMATPALLPKAWVAVRATCSASPCTIAATSGFASVTRTSAGLYTATFSVARTDTAYAVAITPVAVTGAVGAMCVAEPTLTTAVSVDCYDAAGTVVDTGFSLTILDNDN